MLLMAQRHQRHHNDDDACATAQVATTTTLQCRQRPSTINNTTVTTTVHPALCTCAICELQPPCSPLSLPSVECVDVPTCRRRKSHRYILHAHLDYLDLIFIPSWQQRLVREVLNLKRNQLMGCTIVQRRLCPDHMHTSAHTQPS